MTDHSDVFLSYSRTMSTTIMRHMSQLMNRIPIGMCTIRSYTNTRTIQTHTIGMITQADL